MENSHKYFENRDCKYYPCHEGIEELNCLFCYCPLYHQEKCPGNPRFHEKEGKTIKVCTDCTFPHRAENYDKIIELIRASR
jgi:Zn-finger protein